MASIKQYATEICDALDRPYDGMFLARAMAIIRHEAVKLLRESINKNGIDRQLTLRYSEDLEKLSTTDLMYIDEDCIAYRTVNKIYNPVRHNDPMPFTFVGSKDGTPFTYRSRTELNYVSFLSLIGGGISYDYLNQYLYIFGNNRVKKVIIEAIFENPFDIIKELESGNYTEKYIEEEYAIPIPEDIIQIIKLKLISGELSITDDKDKVIATHIDNN